MQRGGGTEVSALLLRLLGIVGVFVRMMLRGRFGELWFLNGTLSHEPAYTVDDHRRKGDMMSDIRESGSSLLSQSISLREACGLLPGSPHVNTARRWADRGVRGVLLETWRVGGRRFTSEGAILEFIKQLGEVGGN